MELRLSDEYLVCHKMIDAEHQQLVNIFNEYNSILSSNDRNFDRLMPLFEKIKEFTVNHFQDEENLMDSFPYSGAEDHKKVHRVMIRNIDHFSMLYRADPSSFNHHQYLNFLQKWLTYHISIQDSKMIHELRRYEDFSIRKNIIKPIVSFFRKIFKGKE